MRITANQVITLLGRDVVIYPRDASGNLGSATEYSPPHSYGSRDFADANESEIAEWVFANRQAAGLQMDEYSTASAQYHAIFLNRHCYGVIELRLNGTPLESFESVMARNEQLRSNLLRSISHDIRTPLTSISGNASNLLSHYEQLDEETLRQIFSDIYDDSEWLVDLVENLLSISRIENGQMELHMTLDIISDVIEEALRHVDRNISRHHVTVAGSDDILLVNMDTGLIMQVLINLINNAIKNTPEGSEITIGSERVDGNVIVSVCDNGPGIADEMKPHIFEMFYTGQNKIADGRRGMGLGLALCKSIIEAHNGTITLTDNHPSGCCFAISLPVSDVLVSE